MRYAIIVLMLVLIIAGCANESSVNGNVIQNLETIDVEKVEVYHFHGNNQCASCIKLGDFAEETVNAYYAKELMTGKIVFGHINAQESQNAELAKKYEVTGSSLWIGVYDKDGKFYKEENVNLWYKLGDKEEYMQYLKNIIDKRFAGDLN